MKNIYIVKIEEKYFSKLIKYHINILKIKKIKNYYLLYLDFLNYEKLLKFKNIFELELIGYKGLIQYKLLFKKYFLFISFFVLALIYLVFLSNIIFKIEIKTEDQEIANLVLKELEKRDISIHKWAVSFSKKESIREDILKNNKDKLEWLEITRVGSTYVVNVEKRIINEMDTDDTPQDIVALKNAIILKIEAKEGSIVKKLNDYVKKGDVIVTGSITHNDEVVDLVRADAIIYGETWYNVHVSYPYAYYEKTYTGNSKKRLSITLFNKKINLFDNSEYKEEEILEQKILYHKFLPFSFSLETVKEVVIRDEVYTPEEAAVMAISEAKEKILSTLPEDSKILSQKKLKIIVNDSTIEVDVFFKVYENITDTKKISLEGE